MLGGGVLGHRSTRVPLADAMFNGTWSRCAFYPRCRLFDCCAPAAGNDVANGFMACMSNCKSFDVPFEQRFAGHPLLGVTISHDLLRDSLTELPFTKAHDFKRLQQQSFRVLYLVQGDGGAPSPMFADHATSDRIELVYRHKGPRQALYYPTSQLTHGRLALYLAGRQQELRQGWLYSYFVEIDDDITFSLGSPASFHELLSQWEPAIGVPAAQRDVTAGFTSAVRKGELMSTLFIEFMMIAYHREALEVLHPWTLEFDHGCIHASQRLQIEEATLLYRQHILTFGDVAVANSKHRYAPHRAPRNETYVNSQTRTACTIHSNKSVTGLHAATVALWHAVPGPLKHCVWPASNPALHSKGKGGPQHKTGRYHLLNLAGELFSKTVQDGCEAPTKTEPPTFRGPESRPFPRPECCNVDAPDPDPSTQEQLNRSPRHHRARV